MDYNNSQMAITPCQLGIIHRNLSDIDSRQRQLLIKEWCDLDSSTVITIRDTVEWKGDIDNRYNIEVMSGGVLSVYCRLSMPQKSSIIVHPGGRLNLYGMIHNDCGHNWNGIHIIEQGNQKGIVSYSTDARIDDVSK